MMSSLGRGVVVRETNKRNMGEGMGKNLFRFHPGWHGFACVLAVGLCVAATDSAVATTLNGMTNYWRLNEAVPVEIEPETFRSEFVDTGSLYEEFQSAAGSNRNFIAYGNSSVPILDTETIAGVSRQVARTQASTTGGVNQVTYALPATAAMTPNFTISFWQQRPAGAPLGNNNWSQFLQNSYARSDNTIMAQYNASTGNWNLARGTAGGAQVAPFPAADQTQWHFVTFVVDSTAGEAGEMNLYFDGVLVPGLYRNYGTYDPSLATTWALGVPNEISRGGSNRYAEMAIWNRALTQAEITLAYNRQSTTGSYGFVAVPEPATPGLLAIGGIAAAAVSCIRRRR